MYIHVVLDLIIAIKEGNEHAFEQAYKQWRSKGYYYFLRKTESAEDAKDLLQSTFLRLWQYRQSLSPEYSLDQQLFHIARTVFIDHIRKANRQEELKLITVNKLEAESLENYQSMAFDAQSRMQKILQTMPAIRKRIFELHKLEGYSYKEIAENLNISEKSVDNHLAKALKQLRKSFGLFPLFLFLLLK